MSLDFPADLRYTDSHEYLRVEGDIAVIGITTYAIEELGDIVFVENIEPGSEVEEYDPLGTIESVKAVSDIISPMKATVIEGNESMFEAPELIPDDPYGEGWLVKVRLDNPDELVSKTLSADEYKALIH